ncbi:hypothetical protein CSUI_002043 [Cystoisospora suis]|uniref:R3H domain-containing protein n=1 Tax=Cystoisospora suis TaxID=483139 RepID=A0A2C6LAH4_9APIC|nr:hypothetical protein CSUI_002043 [Cystoisospora suis]
MKEGDSEMREKMGDLPQGTRMDVVVPPRKQKRQEVDRNEEESERKTDPLLLPQDQRTSDSDRHSRDDGKDEEEEDLKKRMKRVSTSQKNEGKEKEEGERAIGRTWRVKEKTDEKKGKEEGEKKETKDRGPPHEQLEIPPDTIQERDANRYFVEEMMAPHPRSCSSSPLHLFSSSSPSASSPSFSSSPPPPRLGVSWKGSIDGMSDLLRSLTSQLSCQFLLLIEIELSLFLSQILTYHLSLFLSPNAHKMKRLSSQDSHITYTLSFPPLPSFYRRLIHLTCERFNFHTQSSGWGDERSLSVSAVLPFLFSEGPAGPKKIKRRKGVQEKGCEEHFKISRSNRESIRRKEGEREKGRRRDVWTEEPREVKEDNDEEEEEEEDRCLFLRVPSDVEVPVMPSLSLEDFLPQLSYCMTVAPAGSKRKEEKQTKKEETEEKGGEAWRGEQEEEERKRITNDTPGEKEVTGESQGSPKRRQEKTATLEKTSNPQCNEYFSPSFSSSSSSLCSPLEGPSSFSVLGQVIEQVEEGRFKMKELFLLYRCVRLQMEKACNLFERRVLRQERGEDEGEREMMSQFKGQREGTKGDTRREGLERGDRRSDGEQKEMTGSRGDEEEGEKDDTRRRRFPRVEEKDKRDSRLKEGERRREGCAFVGDHKFLSPQKNLACKGDEEEREFRSMGERITSCSSSLLLFTSPLSSLSKTTLGEMEEGEREKGHPSKEEREGENHQEEREGAHSPCKETGEDQKKNEENKKERLEEETKELSGPPVEAKRRKGRGIFSWRKNEEDICRNGTFTSKNKEKKGEENERKDKTKEEEEKKKKNESEGESQSFLRSSSKAILRGGEEEEVSREKEREQGEKEGVGEEDDEASVEEYFPDHISSRPLFSYGAFSFSNCSFFSSFFDLKKRRGRGREGIEEERGQGKFQSLSSSSSACSFISPNRHTLSAPCRQVSLVLPPPSLSPLVKSSRGEGGGQQGEREEEEKTVFFSFFASCTSSPFARLSFHPSWILSSSVSPEEEDEEGDYAEKEFSEFDPQCSVLSFTAEVYKPFTVCLYTREIFPSTHDQSTSPSTCSDRKDRKTPKREEYEDKGESLFSSSRSDRCQHGDSRTSRRTTSSSFLKCHRGPIPSLCLVLLLDFHPDRITQKGWIVHVSRVYIHLKQLSSSRRHPLLLRRGDSRRSSHREDARTGREERRKSKNLSRNLHGLSEEKRHGQNQEEERSRHVSNPCLSICVKDAWEIRQEWEKRCRAAHLLLSKFSPGENMYLKGSMKTENDQEEEQEEENECRRRRRRNRGPIKQERCEGGADDILQERASVQGGGSQSLHNESFPSKLLQTSSASSSLPSHVGTFFVPYREEEEERSEEEKGSQEREKKEKNDFSRSPLSGTPVSIWIAQFPRFLLPPETSPAAPLSSSSPTTGLTSPRLSPSLQENRQAPSSSSPSCSLAFSSAPSSRHPCASSSSSPCASSSSLPPSSSSPPPSSCSSAALSSSFPLLRPSRCCTVLIGRGSYPLSIHGEISFLNIRNHEEEESLPSSCDFKETSFIQEDLPSDDRRRREEKGDDDEEKEDISLAAHLKTSSSLHKNVQERERKERTEVFQGKEEKQEKKSYVMSLQRKEKKDRKEGGEDKGAGEKRERGVGGPRNAFHRARQISSREDADNTIAKFLQNEEVLEEREEETRSLIRKDELEKMVSMDAEEEDREGERDPQNTPFSSKHGKDNKGDGGDDVREEPRSVSRGGDREEDIDLGQKRKADKERRERKRRDEKEEEEETSQVRDCDLQDNDASEEEEPPSREKEGEESRDRIEEILRKTKGTSFSLHSRYSPLSQSYCHPFHRCPCGVCTGQKLFYFSFFAFGVPPPFSSPSPLVFSLPPSLGLKGEKLEGGEKEKEKKERALKNGEENVGCGKTIEEEDDETERKKKKMEAKLSPEDRGREPFSLEKIDERKISYIKTSPHHVNISSPFSTYISPEVRSSSSSLSLRPSESSRVSPRILIGGKNALLRAVAEAALSSTTVRRGRGDDERQKSLLAVYDKKKRREEEISLSQTASMIKKTPSSSVMVSPTRRDLERQGLDGEERRKSISDGREVMKEDRMEKSGVQEREERRKKESLETKTGEREEEEEKDREEPPLSNSLLTGGNRVLDSKNTRKNTIEKEEERRKERETSIGFRGREEEEEEERRGGYQASSQYTSSSGVCTLCTSAMSVLGESCPYHHVIRQIKVLHDVAHISNLSSLSLTLEDEREKKEEEGGESERGMFFSDDLQASLLREWTFSPVIAGRDHIVEIRFSVRGSSCKTGRHLDTRQEADERLICCSPNEKKKKEKGELCLSTDSMKKGGRDTMKKKNLDDSDEDVGGRRDEKEAEGRKRRKTSEEATPEEEEEEGENKKEEEEEGGREWTKEEMDKKRRGREEQDTLENEKGIEEREMQGNLEEEKEKKKKDKIMRIEKEKEEEEMCWKERSLYSQFLPCCLGYFSSPSAPLITTTTDNEWTSRSSSSFPSPFLSSRHRCNPSPSPSSFSSSSCCPIHRKSDRRRHDEREEKEAGERRFFHISCLLNFLLHFTIEAGLPFPSPVKTHTEHQLKEEEKEEEREEGELVPSRKGTVWSLSCEEGWSERRIVVEEDGRKKKKKEGTSVMLHEGGHQSRLVLPLILRFRGGRRERRDNDKTNNSHKETLPHFSTKSTLIRDVQKVKEGLEDFTQGACDNGDDKKKKKKKVEEEMSRRTTPQDEEEEAKEKEKIEKWGEEEEEIVYYAVCISSHAARVVKSLILQWKRFHGDSSFSSSYLCNDCAQLNHYEKRDKTNGVRSSFSNRLLSPFSFPLPLCLFFSCLSSYRRVSSSLASKKKSSSLHFPCIFGCVNTLQVSSLSGVGCLPPSDDEVLSFLSSSRRKEQEEEKETRQEEGDKEEEDDVDDLKARGSSSPTLFLSHRHGQGTCSSSSLSFFSPYMSDNRRSGSSCIPGASLSSISDAFLLPFRSPFPSFSLASSPLHWRRPLWSSSMSVGGLIGAGDRDVWLQRLEKFSRSTIRELGLKEVLSILREDKKKLLLREPLLTTKLQRTKKKKKMEKGRSSSPVEEKRVEEEEAKIKRSEKNEREEQEGKNLVFEKEEEEEGHEVREGNNNTGEGDEMKDSKNPEPDWDQRKEEEVDVSSSNEEEDEEEEEKGRTILRLEVGSAVRMIAYNLPRSRERDTLISRYRKRQENLACSKDISK